MAHTISIFCVLLATVLVVSGHSNGTEIPCGTLKPQHGENKGVSNIYELKFYRLFPETGLMDTSETPRRGYSYIVHLEPEVYKGFALEVDRELWAPYPCADICERRKDYTFLRHKDATDTDCKFYFQYKTHWTGPMSINYTVVESKQNYQTCEYRIAKMEDTSSEPTVQCVSESNDETEKSGED